MTRKSTELAWLAGIIEGEGSIRPKRSGGRGQGRGQGKYQYPSLAIRMTDQDVLDRVVAITGIGRVTGPYKLKQRKDMFRWEVQGPNAEAILNKVSPWFLHRRTVQTLDTLTAPRGRVA